MLLQAGVTIEDGIHMMLDDETDKDAAALMQSLLATVEKGEPLSVALRAAGLFPRFMVSTIEIGEKTGRTVETLTALSAHYDRQDRLSTSIRNAVLYPLILLILMIAVVVILVVKVLPIFNDVFNSLGAQMSPLALSLMRFGGWLEGASTVIVFLFGVILFLALIAWLLPGLRRGIGAFFKNIWGDKGLMGKIASSRFTSAMAMAMASGIDTLEAVKMASALSGGSKAVEARHAQCASLLSGGAPLPDALLQAGILTPRNGRMLSLGSRSGAGDTAMADIAARSDRDVQEEIDRLVGRIEPTLVIIASVMVGVILLSVMLPLMGIMTSIG